MAPPPPPPPGPPPPPTMPAPAAAPSGQERNLLLNSIRQGTKLKKTVTVDKSGPLIAGRVAGVTSSNNDSSRDVVSNNSPRVNGGPPGLGGLFAGGMPKLKPTGLAIGSTTNSSPRSLTSDTKNRGPPPQPPPASQKPNIPTSASDSILTSSPANNGYTTSRPMNGPPVLPSKPPVGGYGKPNVAPKPPVIREPSSPNQSTLHSQSNSLSGSSQTLSDFRGGNSGSSQNLSNFSQNDQANKPSPPPKKISLNGRPGVNRAQSMRAPRSPPVAPTTNPPFPPNVRNNLVKNQSSLHQSQDSLNNRNFMASKTGTLPHNFSKMAPLPPNIPPPPTPNQSQRGTPTRPPISKPPPPPSRPAAPPAPPPPPPHRTSPAPPPPPSVQGRLAPSVPCSGPPAPPQRNSSMRNGAHSYPTDLENRFSQHFHSVSEFPDPLPFRNITKHYNTKSTANAKQPAPQPPVHLQAATHVQLSTKLYPNNTSQC